MQCTFTRQVAAVLGPNLQNLTSASLRHQKLTFIGDNSKKEQLEAVCNVALRNKQKLFFIPGDQSFTMTLGARMMVDMSGGVLENAGICMHRHFNCPLIPGSALKGIARHQAWVEWLIEMEKGHREAASRILADMARIFGYPSGNHALDNLMSENKNTAGSTAFLPAFPADNNWQLVCDIINPHGGNDYTNPVPSFFIAVEKGATFCFAIKSVRKNNGNDVEFAKTWLQKGLANHGIGSKTSAGYGFFCNSQTSSITLKLVTPGFLGGAVYEKAEDTMLRIPSLRGMLRWWWRALYRDILNEALITELENVFWGSTTRASIIVLRITKEQDCKRDIYNFKDRFTPKPEFAAKHDIFPTNRTPGIFYLSYGMDDGGRQRFFIEPGAQWDVSIFSRDGRTVFPVEINGQHVNITNEMIQEQAKVALSLLCRFGGIGSKSRKGFGSLYWDGAMGLDECRQKAVNLCDALSLPILKDKKSDYSFNTAMMSEIHVKWKDPWTTLDRLGLVVQNFAQKYKHNPQKAALGLPRKIHGPIDKPMRHQKNGTHQRPECLLPRENDARQGRKTRFAAPVFYHIDQKPDGGIIRITAFPSDKIVAIDASREILSRMMEEIKKDIVRVETVLPVKRPVIHQRQEHRRPTSSRVDKLPGDIKAGESVMGKLLEEKTKKGGWKVQVSGLVGPIANTGEVPSDCKAGDEISVIVNSANPQSPSFRLPKK